MSELNWQELWDEDEKRYRVQTRDGRKVRIWTIDAWCGCPIRGEVDLDHGHRAFSWTAEGRARLDGQESRNDLIPEPRTVRRWVNVYRNKEGCLEPGEMFFVSKEDARMGHTLINRRALIATVPVEWTE